MSLALLLALACQPQSPRVSTPSAVTPAVPTTSTPGPIAKFKALAQAEGYTVRQGVFSHANYNACCDPGADCLWNNPSTPYGVALLPPAPGQQVLDRELVTGQETQAALAPVFHLREDEAVVLLGHTPPPSKYWSFRSYVAFRPTPAKLQPVLGSLGASFNQLVAAEERPNGPVYNAPLALVTTYDAQAEAQVHAMLGAAGYAPSEIHDDRIASAHVSPGLTAEADTFLISSRVAVVEGGGEAYYADPGLTVLRLTPKVAQGSSHPHPDPALLPRGSGSSEEALAPKLEALRQAVIAQFPEHQLLSQEATYPWFETLDCVDAGFCSGDIRDRNYSGVIPFILPDTETFAVVIGVNHERTGKASYSNLSVDTVLHRIGLTSINSDVMPGSARKWLGEDYPGVDDLYAWMVRRDCAGQEDCVEVPYGCPGVEPNQELFISFRAYLEPSTGVAPLPEELVASQVLLFFPPFDTGL